MQFSLWNYLFSSVVLDDINHIQKYLQIVRLYLEQCTVKFPTLQVFFEDFEGKCTEILVKPISCVTTKYEEIDIYVEKRIKFWRRVPGETTKSCWFSVAQRNPHSNAKRPNCCPWELDTCSTAVNQILSVFTIIFCDFTEEILEKWDFFFNTSEAFVSSLNESQKNKGMDMTAFFGVECEVGFLWISTKLIMFNTF